MKILITGGAGYIGSHTAKQLIENRECDITIIDNLSTGVISAIETLKNIHKEAGNRESLILYRQTLRILE